MDTRDLLVQSILNEVPCRKKEVELLVHLLGEPAEPPPPSIFITGHKSSGKSYTVTNVLKHLNIQHAVISCIEGYTPSLLFDPILKQFSENCAEDENCDENLIETRCEDMMDFIQLLNRKALQDEDFKRDKHVIVLEEAEYLREMASNLLPAFLKLQELTLLKNLCVILVTTLTWEKLSPSGGFSVPIYVYFPQYTQKQLERILLLDCPPKYTQEFYQNYLHLFISVFLRACRDLRELRFKASVNFTKFCEPIENGKADVSDLKSLWQLISPHFKNSLESIYMRTEMNEAEREASETRTAPATHDSADQEHISASTKYALSFELPFFAKYVLIAAYLASYNSHKEDKKMFVKLSGRKKKQKPKINSAAKLSLQAIGPRVFDMSRLLAIFYAIVETKPLLSANLLSQISTLVELQLLHRVGDDALENPKFKCAVGLNFIIIIARTLSFNVTKYLADYK